MPPAVAADDWRTIVEEVAGLSTMKMTDDLAKEIVDLKWVKTQGVWVIERLSFKAWLQERMVDPTVVNEAMRRLIAEGLIGEARVTTQGGKSFRTHALMKRALLAAYEELYAN